MSRGLLSLILCMSILVLPVAAKTQPMPALESGYVSALAAADHFLQAWQSGDVADGMALLTGHAKETVNSDAIEKFFSGSAPLAYEIGRGKLLKRGRYEFPVVLVSVVSAGVVPASSDSKNIHARRRFSSIVVLHSSDNDWVVDKLP
jgi:hypothetical protein